MSFWTTQRIHQALDRSDSPVPKGHVERVHNACYEMALGTEAFITGLGGTNNIHKPGEQLRIPPGQFALLMTEEELRIPLNVLAFISIKASKKISGLVNISGFHVDPGFQGRLKFSVYNAGADAIILDVGEPLFPIWFCELHDDNVDRYDGKHKHQMGITSEDVMRLQGDIASPEVLKRKLDKLQTSFKIWKAMILSGITLSIGTALIAIAMVLLKKGK